MWDGVGSLRTIEPGKKKDTTKVDEEGYQEVSPAKAAKVVKAKKPDEEDYPLLGLSWHGSIAKGFNVLDTDNDSEPVGAVLAEASPEGDDVKRICSAASNMSCDTDGH